MGIGANPDGPQEYSNSYISNFRITKGQALYTSAFTPSVIPITTTSQGATAGNVSILTCQSNRFIDNSTNNLTVNPVGGVSVVAFSPFAPTAPYTTTAVGGSGYFDGTGDYLSVANTGLFGSGDWTVEMWINAPVGQTDKPILECRNPATGSGSTTGFTLTLITSTEIRLYSGAELLKGTVNYINTWAHVAVSKKSGTTRLYLNGTSVASTASLGTMSDTTFLVAAGYYGSTSITAYGQFYMSGLRVLTGTGYDTSTITIPTSPPTAITNTSLLLNFTNAGITDATAKNDLETVGNAQISTTQSKWGGSSIYVDGTGDYLAGATRSSVYFNLTGDFTIETWAYFTTVATGFAGIVSWTDSSGFNGWELINNAGTVYFRFLTGSAGVGQVTASSAISANQWYYISVIRSGSTITLYINGSSVGSTTYSGSQTSESSFLKVGADRVGTSLMTGYLQDMRISKYVRPTTVPTAPFPRQ